MQPTPAEPATGSVRRLGHLAIFLADLQGGGAERMMVNLAAGLVERGVKVDLVLAKAVGPYLSQVPDAVRVVRLDSRGVLAAVPKLTLYLARERPQLMVTTLRHASVIALIARRLSRTGTPVFIREANTPSKKLAVKRPKPWLVGQLIRRLYSQADGVIAVSEGVAEDIRKHFGIPGEKLAVLYNPVVTPDLEERARADLRHAWFEPGQPPVVLAAGRLHPQKDFPTLIRAFARLRQRTAARLLILGEGDERPRLERLVRELGLSSQVGLPGFVDNPFAYMARAGVFVLSSRWEGLPGVLIQALACGCPVVSTDCESGPAEVLERGKFGELVSVGDEAALAGAIERTLAHPPCRERLRSRSQRYSQETVVGEYIQFFASRLRS
jgi:glycosyltransferase involved in cell wall biosynthesis